MKKRLTLLLLSMVLIIANPAHAFADPDISFYAGRFLGDLIALISEEYVGGEVDQMELMEAAIRGMTSVLDPYSGYLDEEMLTQFVGGLSGKMVGLGVQIKLNDDDQHEIARVFPGTPAREAGLKKGDIVTAINEYVTEGLLVDEVIYLIGMSDDEVALLINRGTEELAIDIKKREISSISVYTDTMEGLLGEVGKGHENIRYIAITSISSNTADVLKNVIEGLRKEKVTKIIIDFRGNAGGYMDVAIDICNLLVPFGPVCYEVDARGNRETQYSTLQKLPFEEVVVLVDGFTASGPELIAAAMQDADAALVVGETTFGKGVIQTVFNLSIGSGLKLTTREYLRRSGKKINEVGVIPDYEIATEYKYYESPKDEALLKALELLTT